MGKIYTLFCDSVALLEFASAFGIEPTPEELVKFVVNNPEFDEEDREQRRDDSYTFVSTKSVWVAYRPDEKFYDLSYFQNESYHDENWEDYDDIETYSYDGRVFEGVVEKSGSFDKKPIFVTI